MGLRAQHVTASNRVIEKLPWKIRNCYEIHPSFIAC